MAQTSTDTPSPANRLKGAIGSFRRQLWATNKLLAFITAAGLGLVVITAIGLAVDPRVITGAPAWLKPMKFAISSVIYTGTLAWLLGFVQGHRRLVGLVSWVTTVGLGLELVIIAGQVVRGRASHFNLSTPLDAALFAAMGAIIVTVWTMNLVVAFLLLRQRLADGPRAWSLRLGVLISAAGMGVAFLMTSTPSAAQVAQLEAGQAPAAFGAHSVGVEDGGPGLPLVGWSTVGGDLRIPHFFGLHGLQVLPLLGIALRRFTRLPAGKQLGLVWVGGLGYLGLMGLLTWQALRGQSIIAPDGLTLGALAALLLAAAAASALVVAWPRRAQLATQA